MVTLQQMGFSEAERQGIIDICDITLYDPIELGSAIATHNLRRLNALEIKIPKGNLLQEIWDATCWYLREILNCWFSKEGSNGIT